MYAEKMGAFYTDSTGAKKPLWLASYGIGPTRILGTLVEMFHDDKGIIWPESVAPYKVNLIALHSEDENVLKYAEKVYQELQKEGVEVLYDDRQTAAGEKFSDSDLIGLPFRLVISAKTQDKIEFKKRQELKTELLSFEEVLKKLE
jgi:prolyl-tRNA synthetase